MYTAEMEMKKKIADVGILRFPLVICAVGCVVIVGVQAGYAAVSDYFLGPVVASRRKQELHDNLDNDKFTSLLGR